VNAAQWASGILSVVTACLAFAMVPFVHRARVTAKREGSVLGNRAGFLMEAGLVLFALGALLRGASALALVLNAGEAERAVESWGSIAVSTAALVVFLAMARHMRPMLHALRRSERALSVVLGTFQPESLRPENLGLSLREQEVLAIIRNREGFRPGARRHPVHLDGDGSHPCAQHPEEGRVARSPAVGADRPPGSVGVSSEGWKSLLVCIGTHPQTDAGSADGGPFEGARRRVGARSRYLTAGARRSIAADGREGW